MKKRMRPISGLLNQTSFINGGFLTWLYCDSLGRQTTGNPEQASYWLGLPVWVCFIMHTRGTSHICNYCLTILHIASFNLEPNCFAGWEDQGLWKTFAVGWTSAKPFLALCGNMWWRYWIAEGMRLSFWIRLLEINILWQVRGFSFMLWHLIK